MLFYSFFKTLTGQEVTVELKNGETSRRAPSSSGQNRPRLGRKDWRCLYHVAFHLAAHARGSYSVIDRWVILGPSVM